MQNSGSPERDESPFKHESADDSPGFLLYKITVLWQQKLGAIFASFGIYQTQYAILASLKYFEEKGEASTQSHLVEHARIDKMTLSKAVRALEDAGYVSRSDSKKDARAVSVKLTARGRKLVSSAIRAIEQADEEFFGCLNQETRVQYKSIARTLIENNAKR